MTITRASLLAALGIVTIATSLVAVAPALADGGGEKVYKDKCVSCHGPDGTGNTPVGKATKAPNICSDEAKKATDAELTQIITKGKNKMPSFNKKLTDAEIKDVIAYMRSLCNKQRSSARTTGPTMQRTLGVRSALAKKTDLFNQRSS